jgi:hypothetical protein
MPSGLASTKGYSSGNLGLKYPSFEDLNYSQSFNSTNPYYSDSGKFNSVTDTQMSNYINKNNFGMKRSKIKVVPEQSITINNKKYVPGNKMLINYQVLVLVSITQNEMSLSKGKKKIKYKISELI